MNHTKTRLLFLIIPFLLCTKIHSNNIGIDFGHQQTLSAIHRFHKTQFIKNFKTNQIGFPSIVSYIDEPRRILVGYEAEKELEYFGWKVHKMGKTKKFFEESKNTIRNAKSLLGLNYKKFEKDREIIERELSVGGVVIFHPIKNGFFKNHFFSSRITNLGS